MPDERFEDHLRHPRGRGRAARRRASTARPAARPAATSCACRSPSTATASARPASRPRAAARLIAAAQRRGRARRGRGLLDAARIGSPQIAAELGGLSAGKLHAADLASDALHRALGAAARGARSARADARTARSSRCPAASTARSPRCSARATDADVAAVTLELWADADNDGERSCCSAAAVRGARRLAHAPRPGALHARPARRVSRRRRRPWLRRARRRADAEPVRALQRPRPPRRDARVRRPPRRRRR